MAIEQEWDEGYVNSYDERLSSFGNELELCIREIISSINGSIRRLTDKRLEGLLESEIVLLRPTIQRARQCCMNFTQVDLNLPHKKSNTGI